MSNELGLRIKKHRELIGYSQKRLAQESKLTPAAINMIESGERIPQSDTLKNIIFVLAVDANDILFSETEREKISKIIEAREMLRECLYSK